MRRAEVIDGTCFILICQNKACCNSKKRVLNTCCFSNVLYIHSEINQKKAPGNKLPAALPQPGKNGNLTFADAVTKGYDKSPGEYGALNQSFMLVGTFFPLCFVYRMFSPLRWLWRR